MNRRLLLNYSMRRNLMHHTSECLDVVLMCLSPLNNSQTNCLPSQKRWHLLGMNLAQKVGTFGLRLSIELWLLLMLPLMRTSFHTVPDTKKMNLPLFLWKITIQLLVRVMNFHLLTMTLDHRLQNLIQMSISVANVPFSLYFSYFFLSLSMHICSFHGLSCFLHAAIISSHKHSLIFLYMTNWNVPLI